MKKENVLNLIQNKKYHSCILTSFSFDFYFFELKALKVFRASGIRNVNVLIDGHFYAELMQQTTGDEMKLRPNESYSLYPIFHDSIFHPKVWMFFGEKDGLLIVGSGNLTNAGIGNNDEIWGAFHFNISATENASIFSAAWSYISRLSSTLKGQIFEKTTKWILDHSVWLNDLPKIDNYQFYTTSQKENVSFLFNSDTSSIWTELKRHLAHEDVTQITTVSPYYDKKGKVLQELRTSFSNSEIHVILDETGQIPSLLDSTQGVYFYDWNELNRESTENAKTKLHAKIIHLKTASGREYCLEVLILRQKEWD